MQFLLQRFLFAKVQLNPWVNIEYLHLRQKSNNTDIASEIPGIVYWEVNMPFKCELKRYSLADEYPS